MIKSFSPDILGIDRWHSNQCIFFSFQRKETQAHKYNNRQTLYTKQTCNVYKIYIHKRNQTGLCDILFFNLILDICVCNLLYFEFKQICICIHVSWGKGFDPNHRFNSPTLSVFGQSYCSLLQAWIVVLCRWEMNFLGSPLL